MEMYVWDRLTINLVDMYSKATYRSTEREVHAVDKSTKCEKYVVSMTMRSHLVERRLLQPTFPLEERRGGARKQGPPLPFLLLLHSLPPRLLRSLSRSPLCGSHMEDDREEGADAEDNQRQVL